MYRRRINVRGVIYKNGKIFAQKLKNKDGENNFWSTPGGGLDDGEDLLSGLRREMMEETGIEPQIGRLLFIQQFNDGEKERLEFFFHIENTDDYAKIDIKNTSHGLIEVSQYGFVDPKVEILLPNDLRDIDFAQYINATKHPLIINNL